MKYRKKPVVIEAEQFFSKDWLKGKTIDGVEMEKSSRGEISFWCPTLEGRHIVSEGDWIITGVKGEKYPCKPDIFELTYEKVK